MTTHISKRLFTLMTGFAVALAGILSAMPLAYAESANQPSVTVMVPATVDYVLNKNSMIIHPADDQHVKKMSEKNKVFITTQSDLNYWLSKGARYCENHNALPSPSVKPTATPTATPSASPKPSESPTPSATSSVKPTATPGVCAAVDSARQQEVYRLYNPVTSEHLFTTDKKEYDALAAKHGWKQESTAWVSPDATASSVGVYRLYNPGLGDHHYTKDQNEAAALVNKFGWVYDNDAKPLFYSDDSCQRVPVYRQYNPALRIGQHHYTADENEAKALITKYGWKNEAIGWYAIKR